MERIIIGLLWCGGIGFMAMFVFLGLGWPVQFPIFLQCLGLIGGALGVVAILLDGPRGQGWRRRK